LPELLNGAARMMKPLYSTGSETFAVVAAEPRRPNNALRNDIVNSRLLARRQDYPAAAQRVEAERRETPSRARSLR